MSLDDGVVYKTFDMDDEGRLFLLELIDRDHFRVVSEWDESVYCAACDGDWPCETIVVLGAYKDMAARARELAEGRMT